MAHLPLLDDELQAKILEYVTEPKACLSCKSWKSQLYDSLKLEHRVHFRRRLEDEGEVAFCYNAVRPLGEDFEESVAFNFRFFPNGAYRLAWTRTYDAWSSQGEQHLGKWIMHKDQICCETLDKKEVSETEMRFAPAGYKFAMPVLDILTAEGGYFQAPDGSKAADWELPARTGKCSSSQTWWPSQATEVTQVETSAPETMHRAQPRADARYVEIDGEVHEVSGDIVANYPEDCWERLMACRLRFGIRG
mmetsp:Transcript_1700/g.4315  ORF Transcript_1700/g.4315 Transcript_1700/m.4315 type:complete len:249 (-) Transcript_1700:322-1068(-)